MKTIKGVILAIILCNFLSAKVVFAPLPVSIRQKLEKAETLLKSKRYESAVSIYKELLHSTNAEAMIKKSDNFAIGLKEYVRNKIRSLPKEAKEIYLKSIRFDVSKTFKMAFVTQDMELLKKILLDYPASRFEYKILIILTQEAVDSGKFNTAEEYIKKSSPSINITWETPKNKKFKPAIKEGWNYKWRNRQREKTELHILDEVVLLISYANNTLSVINKDDGKVMHKIKIKISYNDLFHIDKDNNKFYVTNLKQYRHRSRRLFVLSINESNSHLKNWKTTNITLKTNKDRNTFPLELIKLSEKSELIYFTTQKRISTLATHLYFSAFDINKKKYKFTNQWIGSILSRRILRTLSITTADDNLIMFLSNKIILCLNSYTGELIWMRKLKDTKYYTRENPNRIFPSLPWSYVCNNVVYCLYPEEFFITSLDSVNGSVKWNKEKVRRHTMLIGINSNKVILTQRNRVVALSAENGEEIWRFDTEDTRSGVGVATTQYVYAPFGKKIYVLNIETGDVIAERERNNSKNCYLAYDKGRLYILTTSELHMWKSGTF